MTISQRSDIISHGPICGKLSKHSAIQLFIMNHVAARLRLAVEEGGNLTSQLLDHNQYLRIQTTQVFIIAT